MNPLRPKKHLGQNFLNDRRIQEKIIQACQLNVEDNIVEIGPGQGALTQLIAPQVKKLICIETDHDLIEPLRMTLPSTVEIIHADFLKWDFSHFKGDSPLINNDRGTVPFKVIGNIPYYISTLIIEKLIENRSKIVEAFLTVQLEFAERLAAKPGNKIYGSLSCYVQYYADIKLLFKIKNTCFKPAPKVDSCFISLNFKNGPGPLSGSDQVRLVATDEEFLFKLIQTAFQQRRKNIVNALKVMVAREKLEQSLNALDINLNARAENLTLSNYIELSNLLVI
jgi:16S rRNA (adenine1518-N6/adenine1519-N6)-dimethyltransferase